MTQPSADYSKPLALQIRNLNRYEVASLQRRMHRFLDYTPEDSEFSYSHDSKTGIHRFTSYEGLIQKLDFSREEWQYLLEQHRLSSPFG